MLGTTAPAERFPPRSSEAHVVTKIMRPFLTGLRYLHGKGIMHRDIKVIEKPVRCLARKGACSKGRLLARPFSPQPENILFSADGTLKIADLGLSIVVNDERPVTRRAAWQAPHVHGYVRV